MSTDGEAVLHREEESHSGLKPVNIIVAPDTERKRRSGVELVGQMARGWDPGSRLASRLKTG